MTEQKLRKFKLIDREGYVKIHPSNAEVLGTYLLPDNTYEGVINGQELWDYLTDQCLIEEIEFKFFEEVFYDVKEEFIPTLNEVCEVSRADDLETWYKFIPRAKYTPHYLSEEQYVGDWQSEDVSWKVEQISVENFVFRPIPEKTWQEKLCDEFPFFLKWNKGDQLAEFTGGYIDEVKLAKRIIELSEGGK